MTITTTVDQNAQIDPRDPVARLENPFDPASLEFLTEPDASGALAPRGQIDGVPTVAYATDATVMGGAMGLDGCRHIFHAIDGAIEQDVPVVGGWPSEGARRA